MYLQVDVSNLTADQLSVREAVHSVLMSLCTSVKLGIVFHDRAFGSTKQFCTFFLHIFIDLFKCEIASCIFCN